jgi:hypothetical protein
LKTIKLEQSNQTIQKLIMTAKESFQQDGQINNSNEQDKGSFRQSTPW